MPWGDPGQDELEIESVYSEFAKNGVNPVDACTAFLNANSASGLRMHSNSKRKSHYFEEHLRGLGLHARFVRPFPDEPLSTFAAS